MSSEECYSKDRTLSIEHVLLCCLSASMHLKDYRHCKSYIETLKQPSVLLFTGMDSLCCLLSQMINMCDLFQQRRAQIPDLEDPAKKSL